MIDLSTLLDEASQRMDDSAEHLAKEVMEAYRRGYSPVDIREEAVANAAFLTAYLADCLVRLEEAV